MKIVHALLGIPFVIIGLVEAGSCFGAESVSKVEIPYGPTPSPVPIVINFPVERLAADPVRPRVYATLPDTNSVLVIDTDSLSVIKTIPIGSIPRGLAVSADGTRLWVANSGSTTAAIGVIDLETLVTLPSMGAPVRPSDIKEGADHRLYLTPATNVSDGVMQIDAITGAYQTSFEDGFDVAFGFLETSLDRRTLFLGESGSSSADLKSFNVSSAMSALIQSVSLNGYSQGLRVSHNGQFVVFPSTEGNGLPRYSTFKIPTSNITASLGSFGVGMWGGPGTFSNDDTLLYHSVSGVPGFNLVEVFDVGTLKLIGAYPLPNNSSINDVVVDRSGRWLFVSRSDSFDPNDLRVIDTGRIDPLRPAQLGNISTRMRVLTGANVLIGGFIVQGSSPKRVIIRGLGPSLSQIVTGSLSDPMLELYQGETLLSGNNNWKTDQQAEIEATGLAPLNDLESAIVRTLDPGAYTAILSGINNSVGTGLVEIYDLDSTGGSQLGNISTRGFVDTGDNVMIGGIIVPPTFGSIRVIVRAVGPSLGDLGVDGALQDPTLELHDGSGTTIASNDDWRTNEVGGSQEGEIEATGIPPMDDRESALVRRLAPGNYTAIVRGKSTTTGVALIEAYDLPADH